MSGYTVQGGAVQTTVQRLPAAAVTLFKARTQTLVVGIYAAIAAAGTPTLTVQRYEMATGQVRFLALDMPFPTSRVIQIDLLVTLKADDEIRAFCSAANGVDMFLTYIDGDKTARGNGFSTGGQW